MPYIGFIVTIFAWISHFEELNSNLSLCFPSDKAGIPRDGIIKGTQMPVDELKISERLQWDPRTNMILGACCKHSLQCALEYCSQFQANTLLKCLKNKTVHLASEATVIGAFAILGTCKQKTISDQETLLWDSSDALKSKLRTQNCCLYYCLLSDGNACRCCALISITLNQKLPATLPIHPLLAPLPLFDLSCGKDDITLDFDCKHVLKRFWNTLLCQKGVTVDGVSISTSTIKAHLVDCGMSLDTANTLLAPNNKQDVVLMLKLLPQAVLQSTCQVLCLLRKIYGHLLHAYTNEKGEFIPVQTCFDMVSMIKNVFFCIAKVQKDNPDGLFWLILVGSNGLEKVFGKVQTMVGNNTNVGQYQLTNCINGAVQCVNILEKHPEWGGQARQLTTKPLPSKLGDVSSKYNHISSKLWVGDVHVKNVVLSGCWSKGRRIVEDKLCKADINVHSAWVSIDNKKVHKATIMRLYSNPFAISDSKD
ncbi:hypothetical protein B0H34DRAFT_782368 [Crassisporium funariophilum]|nr:hypothetical protein B0H34DRAFT_782368 [Crassisporium funariophilum]